MKHLTVVSYAMNGTGVGHLTRQLALARWIRRYGGYVGSVDHYFLTTSEADTLLFTERFASFKMPSKTAATESGIDRTTYVALAKQWVWHTLGLLRPDLLIVDTFPRGSFGELLGALDLCKRKVFVYRPSKDELSKRPDFQAMLPLYDLILVPEEERHVSVDIPAAARDSVVHMGPILARERVELLSREDARRALSIPDDAFAIYVSAGGGGDVRAEEQLERGVRAALAEPKTHVVVGAGALYRGRRMGGERMTVLSRGSAAEVLTGCDLAISAAGYNTFGELMLAGVPTIFWPQEKAADDQRARARRAVRAGAALLLEDDSEASLGASIRALREETKLISASAAARALMPENRAREAAAECLRLVLPARRIDAAAAAIDDDFVRDGSALEGGERTLIEILRLLETGHDPTAEESRRASLSATSLARTASSRPAHVLAALKTVVRSLPQGSVRARVRACREALEG